MNLLQGLSTFYLDYPIRTVYVFFVWNASFYELSFWFNNLEISRPNNIVFFNGGLLVTS